MRGRVRFAFDGLVREQTNKRQAFDAAISVLRDLNTAASGSRNGRRNWFQVAVSRGHNVEGHAVYCCARETLDDQLARIHFAMDHPEASLKFDETEGFKFLSDDEMLFRVSRPVKGKA